MTNSQSDRLAKLIDSLGDRLNLTGAEIADVLWLALQRQEFEQNRKATAKNTAVVETVEVGKKPISVDKNRQKIDNIKTSVIEDKQKKAGVYAAGNSSKQGKGLSLRVPDAPSLREPIHLARSLQPLMRRIATGRMTILDESATVQRIAEQGICIPVMHSELEPWLDLALVVDESQSMLIWRHTIKDLQRLLSHYGIFRDIRIWGIKPNDASNELQVFSRMGSNHRLASPKELVDPTGRRLVLIVSDCVSNIWRKGLIFPALQEWTQKQPLAILQMLPERMWRRTALGLGTSVEFSSSLDGAANRDLLVNKKFLLETRTKVPILTMEPELAVRWSQMLVGKADALTSGYILPVQLDIDLHPQLQKQQQAIASQDVSQRVQRFRSTTSPLGRKLAGLLAAAPFINLPVVRLIQQTLLPQSRSLQVAEVFLGGLLQPRSEISSDTNPDAVEYEFIAVDCRDILLEDSPVSDSVDVLNAVSRYVAAQMGRSLSEFMALLKDSSKDKGENVKPFAELTARILRKLGGEYAELANELETSQADEELLKSPETTLPEFLESDSFDEVSIQILKLEMETIPAGSFMMGAPKAEKDSNDDDRPQHKVSVPDFMMGKYPITQAQWQFVAMLPKVKTDIEPDPSKFKGEDRPVEQVSWLDAVEFCRRLSVHTKREYRLPSEAEWEYACRAGTTTAYSFGDNTAELGEYAWYGENSDSQTHPVGQKQPNAFGLYDMHGNVWEWCADDWHESYKGAPKDGSVWIKDNKNYEDPETNKLLRGGSWYFNALGCRSAYRYLNFARLRNLSFGFRVVCVLR
jgi:formylglycine-generating enzyme required for sulfatase activity